jgi:hypothetical protein
MNEKGARPDSSAGRAGSLNVGHFPHARFQIVRPRTDWSNLVSATVGEMAEVVYSGLSFLGSRASKRSAVLDVSSA